MNEEQLERLAEAHRAGMSATELTARTGLPWRTVATAIRMVRDRTRGPSRIHRTGRAPVTGRGHGMKGSDWRGRAACSRLEPDIFYPVGDGAYAREMTEIAKQACLSCPVRAECLRQALETGEQYGIWGGMTPEERRDLARRNMRRRRIDAAVRMRGLAR